MTEIPLKPNILIVHNHYKLPGGEDTVVENERRLLEENGHRVFLYTRSNNLSFSQKVLLPFTMLFNLRTWFDIRKLIRQNKIDIVHVHNTAHVISPAVYYAAKSLGVPVIQTIHNYRMNCPAGTLYRDRKICSICIDKGLSQAIKYGCCMGSKLRTLAIVLGMKLHRSTGIYRDLNYITLSRTGKEILLRSGQVRPDHVHIKANFTYTSHEHRTDQNSKEGYYLFAGRLEEMKGIRLLIEAFRQMPDKKLKIAGTGPLEEKIRRMIREKGLKNIELLGWVPREDMPDLMKNASALILCPQMRETFSMAAIEAFAEHTPVIGGNIENISRLVKHNINGILFQYDSAQSLMEAVMEFETRRGGDLAENAFKTWQEAYSPEQNYRELRDIYADALRSKQ